MVEPKRRPVPSREPILFLASGPNSFEEGADKDLVPGLEPFSHVNVVCLSCN